LVYQQEVGVLASTSFLDHFEDMPDPRMERQRLHSLENVLFIAVCAVICGASSFVDMEDFGNAKLDWLSERLDMPNGVPSHDTFQRVFSLIDPVQFERCFISWTESIRDAVDGDIIAFDGKTLRRSFNNATGMGAIHVLNAWSSSNGFCIGQMKVDGKSNEITAMPELIRLLDIRGCVVTADALNCQKDIAREVIEGSGDYVLAVKANQPSLYEDIRLFLEDAISEGFEVSHGHQVCNDWGHGRTETRECWSVEVKNLEWFKHDDWAGLSSIVCLQSTRRTRDSESVERRYFIASFDDTAKIARAIRHHWHVENKLHWILDVDFDEDACRARTDHAPENFALLRQIAHNLIRRESSRKVSIRRKINKAGWDNDFLARIVAGF
jgi:predicted transposase YbfD/YdcC